MRSYNRIRPDLYVASYKLCPPDRYPLSDPRSTVSGVIPERNGSGSHSHINSGKVRVTIEYRQRPISQKRQSQPTSRELSENRTDKRRLPHFAGARG
jgi:hypothetical protein